MTLEKQPPYKALIPIPTEKPCSIKLVVWEFKLQN